MSEQTDAEIGALVRAAYARHNAGELVELEAIETVDVDGVIGPGELLIRVKHQSRLKAGAKR